MRLNIQPHYYIASPPLRHHWYQGRLLCECAEHDVARNEVMSTEELGKMKVLEVVRLPD